MNRLNFNELVLVALIQICLLGAGQSAHATTESDLIHFYVGTYTNGESQGIYLCELNANTGAIENLGLAGECKNPSFLAIRPDGRFLYAVSEVSDGPERGAGGLAAFAIDPQTRRLTRLNEQSSHGRGPCHVVLDKSGRHALVANYGGGSVAVLPIGDDGKLGAATSAVQHQGKSVNPDRQEGPHAHSIYVSGDQRFALVADLGLDKVLVYRFDPAAGTLVANDPAAADLPPGAGPRHLAFHPSERWVYVINELANTVTAFRYDAERGALKSLQTVGTLPEGTTVDNTTAEIVVHPSGRFLYGSNRGDDSIATFAIDESTGRLTPLGNHSTGGKTPRSFAIDPSGRWLLAANQGSGTITVHPIDPETGKLEATEHVARVPSPVCIQMLSPGN